MSDEVLREKLRISSSAFFWATMIGSAGFLSTQENDIAGSKSLSVHIFEHETLAMTGRRDIRLSFV